MTELEDINRRNLEILLEDIIDPIDKVLEALNIEYEDLEIENITIYKQEEGKLEFLVEVSLS